MDFDKVFTAFRNCISEPKCKDCPWEQCEQFNQKKVTIPVTLALDVLNLLKELEAVKPIAKEDDTFECVCGAIVGWEELDSSGIVATRLNYCPYCGKAVKWK